MVMAPMEEAYDQKVLCRGTDHCCVDGRFRFKVRILSGRPGNGKRVTAVKRMAIERIVFA